MLLLKIALAVLPVIGYGHGVANKIVSSVVRLGDVAYYMHPIQSPKPQIDSSTLDSRLIAEPCTILTIKGDFPTLEELRTTIAEFKSKDDVWSSDFAQCIVVQMIWRRHVLTNDEMNALRNLGVRSINFFYNTQSEAELPQGPYFLHHGQIYQAYRLYPDTSGAFIVSIVSTVPDDGDGFRSLDVSAYGEQHPSTLSVAVPSRLYHTKTKERPYAGLRIAIKDIIDLKGLKTGASSRAYTELYPVKEANSGTVQRLIELGFVFVGKLKTTQFADSEWPTCDWIDYHGPFNPRGDGYLTPSGSSAGSASAVASYTWLDFSLGTDTLGSIRAPAAAQAIFSMRPTLGATSVTGMVPYSPNWDTIAGFARTAAEYKTLAQALYGSKDTDNKIYKACKPTKLIYPTDYWQVDDEASQQAFESFITRIENFLGVKRTEISIADMWKETRPEGADESIAKYFHYVFDWSANRDQWTGLFQPFIEDFTQKMGKAPVLNPQIRFKVGYTQTVTAEQKAEGDRLLKIYHHWFYEHIMPPTDDGYSSSIMILPWTNGEPNYRDTYKEGPQAFTGQGFFFYNIGPYAQCPELVFPIGTTPYTSKFTGEVEQLPAAVGLLAAKGSDIMLADLVSKIFDHMDPEINMQVSEQVPLEDEL
ncbi:putative glutamyl-tRNA amidotransferase subunit A [Nemania sp. FL0031]|nr:putative glutamyl-tRNA amidotransferase subunit A [Nemania sp. FL0031]